LRIVDLEMNYLQTVKTDEIQRSPRKCSRLLPGSPF
jgi:hypothetical protein